MSELGAKLIDLAAVMERLRRECPWDAQQTHQSLVKHLIEETAEVVDAIEAGDDDDLCEELGDLLLQVVFHAEIARTQKRFDLDDIAEGIIDKLIRRHPYVFGSADVPEDMMNSWEEAKRAEKSRLSVLDGIPNSLDTLARAAKVISRADHVHLDVGLPQDPINADELGQGIINLIARAQASDVDVDQATRIAIRELEARIQAAEPTSAR